MPEPPVVAVSWGVAVIMLPPRPAIPMLPLPDSRIIESDVSVLVLLMLPEPLALTVKLVVPVALPVKPMLVLLALVSIVKLPGVLTCPVRVIAPAELIMKSLAEVTTSPEPIESVAVFAPVVINVTAPPLKFIVPVPEPVEFVKLSD